MIHLFIILNLFSVTLVCSVIPVCESYIINFVIFLLLFMSFIKFFLLFMSPIILFQLSFNFIYNIFFLK